MKLRTRSAKVSSRTAPAARLVASAILLLTVAGSVVGTAATASAVEPAAHRASTNALGDDPWTLSPGPNGDDPWTRASKANGDDPWT
ncbi:hypothetical protein [Streptomyces sp. NPDC048442]|uniref:hypothetical protein n=1 Tax=Streptomyces sp. NPDC048442 TaxID=3154823 RepID=UPI00341229A7